MVGEGLRGGEINRGVDAEEDEPGYAGGDGEGQNIPDDDISRRGGFMPRAAWSLWMGLDAGRGNSRGTHTSGQMDNGLVVVYLIFFLRKAN